MKGGALGLTLILLLGIVQLPQEASAVSLPHGPIVIRTNADFTAANGVVAGTGTVADPFIIAGWHVKSAQGTAIHIENVTAAFVVRDNILDGMTGLRIIAASGTPLVQNNHVITRVGGILVANTDAIIRDNTLVAPGGFVSTGIRVDNARATVHANSIDSVALSIVASGGSTTITANDIHRANTGIYVELEARTQIVGNNVTVSATTGIHVFQSVHVAILDNTVLHAVEGVRLRYVKDADFDNNTVRFARATGVAVIATSGNLTANVVIDGGSDAIVLDSSVGIVARNRIENNLGVGITSGGGACDIEANVIISNQIGIRITAGIVDPCHLRSNILVNNSIGLDIPYEARQTIHWMSGNLVNGVNVDGTIVASERVYFRNAANVVIAGQVRDSGFSAGYFGSLTAQGNVVLYDVDNARIESSLISHARVGVTVVNSFNVVVSNSTILDTTIGVSAQSAAAPFPVIPCAVSVKNTTINITIDPPQTIGIDVGACLVNVQNVTIGTYATGIRMGIGAWGNVSGSRIIGTATGLDVTGLAGEVSIVGNTVAANRVGARFNGADALVLDNRFEANTRVGVQLERGSRLAFAGNVVAGNGEGVADLSPCPQYCSSLESEANLFLANRGDGARVNGTSTFTADAFVSNRATGARLGSATLIDVTASGNGEDGASSRGRLVVRDSLFTANARHGLSFTGSADIRASEFTWNGAAGIRATPTTAQLIRVNASNNYDGLLIEAVSLSVDPAHVSTSSILAAQPGATTLSAHLSAFLANDRDAIRASGGIVNATHNWFGGMPAVNLLDQVGAFQNGVSPTVRVVPWFADAAMTTTGPVPVL